ncbi:MAG TPA: hypothetical protein VK966_04465, partial [Longimicrobiales bacterium]|nr:hypothetical protein [Longimicrobiales bacterium]
MLGEDPRLSKETLLLIPFMISEIAVPCLWSIGFNELSGTFTSSSDISLSNLESSSSALKEVLIPSNIPSDTDLPIS